MAGHGSKPECREGAQRGRRESKAAGIGRLALSAVQVVKLQQETVSNHLMEKEEGMTAPVTVGKSKSGLGECFPWGGGGPGLPSGGYLNAPPLSSPSYVFSPQSRGWEE